MTVGAYTLPTPSTPTPQPWPLNPSLYTVTPKLSTLNLTPTPWPLIPTLYALAPKPYTSCVQDERGGAGATREPGTPASPVVVEPTVGAAVELAPPTLSLSLSLSFSLFPPLPLL